MQLCLLEGTLRNRSDDQERGEDEADPGLGPRNVLMVRGHRPGAVTTADVQEHRGSREDRQRAASTDHWSSLPTVGSRTGSGGDLGVTLVRRQTGHSPNGSRISRATVIPTTLVAIVITRATVPSSIGQS